MTQPRNLNTEQPAHSHFEQLGWRTTPGILAKQPTSPQSVHALLGYFLSDRNSPSPFPGRE